MADPLDGLDSADLAGHRPGQLVRAEAERLLAETRGRSRVRSFVERALDLKTDERAFRLGAVGEETVGPRLERLTGRGWRVLHSIPIGGRGADVDHLLIGPGGVYSINTKNHPGGRIWVGEHAVVVNGSRTQYLAKARREADRVRAALGGDVPVQAVLVFLTGTSAPRVTVRQDPDGVLVLEHRDVPRVFKRMAQWLEPARVDELYELARRRSTWI